MSMQQKLRTRGIVMLVGFFILLAVIFSPVFPGKMNGLDYMDNIFNMISKGSSYFIPKEIKASEKYLGKVFEATVSLKDQAAVQQVVAMVNKDGVTATPEGDKVSIKGDMGVLMQRALVDADMMFNNNGQSIADKYGFSEREALNQWWQMFGTVSKELTKQENFAAAKAFTNIQKKALEPAYNYYGVAIEKWQDNIWLVLASLAFYVVYTLWYGFGLMYLFEGAGLRIGH